MVSFRHPNYQNFHKTLLLPPPTTLYGLAGAAMGLSHDKAQDYFIDNKVVMGVYGKHNGKVSDLWKFIKDVKKYKENTQEGGRDILQKEYHVQSEFILIFGVHDENNFKQLHKGFKQPTYALTLGNSDSLIKITNIESFTEDDKSRLGESNSLENCMYYGNITHDIIDKSDKNSSFSFYSGTTEALPTKFKFSEYKKTGHLKREVADVEEFTFITDKVKLNFSVKGIFAWDIFIPTFQINYDKTTA